MARLVLFLLLLIPVSTAALWVMQHPGTFSLEWQGYAISLSMVAVVISLALLLIVAGAVGIAIWQFYTARERRALTRRLAHMETGMMKLTHGFTALAAGKPSDARKAFAKAAKMLPASPLPHLLSAQAGLQLGDVSHTELELKALLQHPSTAYLATRQLITRAYKQSDTAKTERLIAQAKQDFPRDSWVAEQSLRFHTTHGRFDAARDSLSRRTWSHPWPRAKRSHLLARVVYLQATSAAPVNIPQLAESLRLDARFTPASIALARAHLMAGNHRDARKVIERAWPVAPCQPLADLWAEASSFLPEKEQKKLALRLAKGERAPAENYALAARIALRIGLKPEAAKWSRQAVDASHQRHHYLLLAEALRSAEGEAAAKTWYDSAASASEDGSWACVQCGSAHAHWQLVCQHCESFDTVDWREARPTVSETLLSASAA
jgi:HemY protein